MDKIRIKTHLKRMLLYSRRYHSWKLSSRHHKSPNLSIFGKFDRDFRLDSSAEQCRHFCLRRWRISLQLHLRKGFIKPNFDFNRISMPGQILYSRSFGVKSYISLILGQNSYSGSFGDRQFWYSGLFGVKFPIRVHFRSNFIFDSI